jgi:hypothetical protein
MYIYIYILRRQTYAIGLAIAVGGLSHMRSLLLLLILLVVVCFLRFLLRDLGTPVGLIFCSVSVF